MTMITETLEKLKGKIEELFTKRDMSILCPVFTPSVSSFSLPLQEKISYPEAGVDADPVAVHIQSAVILEWS